MPMDLDGICVIEVKRLIEPLVVVMILLDKARRHYNVLV